MVVVVVVVVVVRAPAPSSITRRKRRMARGPGSSDAKEAAITAAIGPKEFKASHNMSLTWSF